MGAAAIVLTFTFLVNIPFGYWRAGTRKLSVAWFLAVHGPVPLIALLRLGTGLDWRWGLLPLAVLLYLGGQILGGRLRARLV